MHIFLYEWATGGGLVDQPTLVPPSLLREGAAMVSALAADLVKIQDCQVTALRDMRVIDLCLPGSELIDVHSEYERREEFERLAAEADGTILIAPEFDDILHASAKAVSSAGGNLFSPPVDFVKLTTNKHRTALMLAGAGIPVPEAVILEVDEPLPKDFPYPAVLKPIDGAGSQDIQLVVSPHDDPLPYAWSRRLERFYPGLQASVAILSGLHGIVTLPACRQVISGDGRLRYLGGSLPLSTGLDARAKELAARTLAALPDFCGYAGVDLILGRDPDGSEDVVLEINPRLTTSYVGLRAAAKGNLAAAMIHHCEGKAVELEFDSRAIEFDTVGNVSWA